MHSVCGNRDIRTFSSRSEVTIKSPIGDMLRAVMIEAVWPSNRIWRDNLGTSKPHTSPPLSETRRIVVSLTVVSSMLVGCLYARAVPIIVPLAVSMHTTLLFACPHARYRPQGLSAIAAILLPMSSGTELQMESPLNVGSELTTAYEITE